MKEKYLRRQYYLKELSKVFFLIKLTILFLLLGIFQTNAHIKGESDISPNTNPLKIKNEIEKI